MPRSAYSQFPPNELPTLHALDARICERLLALEEQNILACWCSTHEQSHITWIGNGAISADDTLNIATVFARARFDLWLMAAPPRMRAMQFAGATVPGEGKVIVLTKKESRGQGHVEIVSMACALSIGDLIAWAQRSVDINYPEGTYVQDRFAIIPDLRTRG